MMPTMIVTISRKDRTWLVQAEVNDVTVGCASGSDPGVVAEALEEWMVRLIEANPDGDGA